LLLSAKAEAGAQSDTANMMSRLARRDFCRLVFMRVMGWRLRVEGCLAGNLGARRGGPGGLDRDR
jgi:hypothetical protein